MTKEEIKAYLLTLDPLIVHALFDIVDMLSKNQAHEAGQDCSSQNG